MFFSFAIILRKDRERELVALQLLSYGCPFTVNVMWLFLTVPWVGLQCVIGVFPNHTHLRFGRRHLYVLCFVADNELSSFNILAIYDSYHVFNTLHAG